MKPRNQFIQQLSDMLAYLVIPMLSLLMPASASRRMIAAVSRWDWLMRPEAAASCARAAEYTAIDDAGEWMTRWRRVAMLEARDRALLAWGRHEAVFAEIEGVEHIEHCRDRVLVGMHWGPSIVILSLLRHRGLQPLLVYRDEPFSIFWQRPFFYLYMAACVRYIRRNCGERAVLVKGAGAALRRELARPGASVVVLDAPPAPGRSTLDGIVLGRPVRFNAGFPQILADSEREFLFYAISLAPGERLEKRLELTAPARPGPGSQFLEDYCSYLSTHLEADSAQWRLWQVAPQFFVDKPVPETGSAEPPRAGHGAA